MRLTAPDGYTASRSYSVASAPDGSGEIELTVERLDDGEVSTFLHDVVEAGDELEVRGPIGGWFVWDGDARAARRGRIGRRAADGDAAAGPPTGRADLVRLVVSVRSPADLYYADELPGSGGDRRVHPQAPRVDPPAGRLTAADLAPLVRADATAYVCGSAAFADAASDLLVGLGVPRRADPGRALRPHRLTSPSEHPSVPARIRPRTAG